MAALIQSNLFLQGKKALKFDLGGVERQRKYIEKPVPIRGGEEKPTRCHSMIYCSCELLYMFRALMCPSLGASRLYLDYNTRCEVLQR
jgi:hypothetical protein